MISFSFNVYVKWKSEYQSSCDEYDQAKRNTSELLQPLKSKLGDLSEQIKEQESRIQNLKAANLRRTERIEEQLRDLVLGS